MIEIQREDLRVAIAGDGVEVRTGDVGELTVSMIRLPKGADLAPALRGLPGDLCPCPHWGYLIRGRIRMRTPDGPVEFTAGRAFYWAPGHAPEALEDSEYVDFSPTDEFRAVLDHLRGG